MLAPRIAVLRHIPFVVPFSDRVRLFHALINRDRSRLGVGSLGNITSSSPFGMHTAARATVRRGRIFDDGFRALGRSDMFKRRMQIEFVDRYGMPEAGIDGGGVFKEFLTSLVREAFDPGEGLFNATAQNNLYPNPESVSVDAADKQLMLDKYEFLGAVIGKALYEGVLVDAPFALFFLGRWLSQLPGFNDLPTLDEDLYRGLVVLKNYPVPETSNGDSSDEDDVIYSVFGLDFTTTVSTADGQTKSVPLAPKGDAIKVTSHNRLLYLDLVAQYKLVKQIDTPVRAFLSGLHAIIPPVWLRLLFASPLELSRLLCGDSGAIDITDWKRNTVYAGAFSGRGSEHPTVRIFWDVVENSLTERQCRELCKFATSCERPPLLGFSELNPRFCIRSSDDGDESLLTDEREQNARLPSASTCVNLLKLPIYSSRQVLLEKLTTAIESGAGFDLS
ncbi:hypothetical protein GQ54DRAFT_281661 [Martensiomyces pterosporus]|nr:hypothetical protein GQ54DRAFT_281661 [Martensiomyces pterosporus]